MVTIERTINGTEAAQRLQILEPLNDAMIALARARTQQDVLAAVTPLLQQYQFSLSLLALLDEDEQGKMTIAHIVAARSSDGNELPLSIFPSLDVVTDNFPLLQFVQNNPDHPFIIEDVMTDARTDDEAARAYAQAVGVQSTILLPLRSEQWQGFITFNWPHAVTIPAHVVEQMEALLPVLTTVVERQRTYLRAQESEYKNRVLIESIRDAFFAVDRNWVFTYVNEDAERLLLHKRSELLGQKMWDIYADTVDTQFYHDFLRSMNDNTRLEFRTYYAPLASWFDVVSYPSQEGLSIYFRDVNDVVSAQKLLERQARELQLAANMSAVINRLRDPDELLQVVVDLIKETFDYYHAHIYLFDPETANLELAAGSGEAGRIMKLRGHSIPLAREHSLVARTARSHQEVIANDVTVEHDFMINPLLPYTQSELAVPILIGDDLLGVLDIQSKSANQFDEGDAGMKTSLAEQIATALVNARAFAALQIAQEEEQKRAAELEIVSRVSTAVASQLDLDELLSSVCELTKSSFSLYHVHIYLLDEERKYLNLTAGAGEAGRIMRERHHRISLGQEHSLVARAARSGQTVVSNNVIEEPDFLPNTLLPDTLSEMALPLVVGGNVIGVLDVQSDVSNRFMEGDVRVKTALASQVAVAVENARAFAALQIAQEEEQKRAAELEIVSRVSAAVASQLDLDELLSSVCELTKSSFSLYHVHIYLLDEERKYLNLTAGAGEAGRIMRERHHRISLGQEHSLVARAARSGQTVVSNNVIEEPDFLPNTLLPDTLSEMALPLVIGGNVIGVLDVQSDVSNRFMAGDVRVKTSLASQVAVAVENARSVQAVLLHEAAIENSTSGMTIADAIQPDMPLVYINPAFEKITGYTVAEAMGRNCRFLQGDDQDQPALYELRAALKEGRETTVILRNYRKDGGLFYNELRLSPLRNARGQVTHFVGVQSDITDRMELDIAREEMLKRAEEQTIQERQTVERLRQVDRMKSQFLANMSHELRTPLNSIIGYSEVLLDGDDGDLSGDALEDIDTIHSSGQHLLSIINDILDLAKIEAGEMRMDRQYIDLASILNDIAHVQEVLIKDKPVTLSVDAETPLHQVYADAIRVRQIVMNLVNNAVKFTEQGSISIRYGQHDDGMAYVRVTDTGIGMEAEDIPTIFEQFRQVDGSSTRRAGGTGLGLTITRYLVQMHGGQIEVESAVGRGSIFTFTLPTQMPERVAAL